MKRRVDAQHTQRSVNIMTRLDAVKEKFEVQRDEARAVWVQKNRGIHNPSVVPMEKLLEVDDARRAYVLAQVALNAATLMWIAAEEAYENGSSPVPDPEVPRTQPGSSAQKS